MLVKDDAKIMPGKIQVSNGKLRQEFTDERGQTITIVRPDLKVIWANRAAATKMGKEPAAMFGLPCHLLRFGRIEPCDNCPVQTSLRTLSPAQS